MAQTYPVLECILVDDASPDDSIAKCEKLVAEYDGPTRFVILHHDKNRGLSVARNTGTDAAKGDYIFYLDSDDELTPDCIEKLAKPIERDASIEMVVGNYQALSENPYMGSISREEEFTSSEAVRVGFFERRILYVAAWNRLILKKFLTENELRFADGILYEDDPWTYYLVKKLRHLYVIPDITYHYCVRPLSICTGTNERKKAKNRGIVFEEIAKHFTSGEEAREAKYYLGTYYYYFWRYPTMDGYKRALPFFEKALSGSEYRKERLRLLMLRLSSKSAFLHRTLAALLKTRQGLLYPIRRLAAHC